MMHIYGITNQRQTRGEPPFKGHCTSVEFQGLLAKSINNTSVYFNKQCRRCHVTASFLLGAAWGWLAPPASCPKLCVYLKGALIQAWKYEYSLDTLWLFVAFLSWPKALPLFQLAPQSVVRGWRERVWRWRRRKEGWRAGGDGGGGGVPGSQALINDRVRAVTQKDCAEEQPRAAKLPPVRRRAEQQKPGLCGRVSAELRRTACTNDGTVKKLRRELRFLSSRRLTRVTNLRKMLGHLSPGLTACHNLFYKKKKRKKSKKRIHNVYSKTGLILLKGCLCADRWQQTGCINYRRYPREKWHMQAITRVNVFSTALESRLKNV